MNCRSSPDSRSPDLEKIIDEKKAHKKEKLITNPA